ncbi:MAG: redoxin domain-containing protein [Actinobacteria bacterium]|nr:redoxin domain-containing protein [Actinomycetota bacterium]
MKVRDRAGRLEASGAAALFVVHDEPRLVRSQLLAGVGELPFPVLVDREREAYRRWGLGRAAWWRVWLDPKVWQQYARLLTSGQRIRGSGEDTLQLGGDFVVAPDGTIAYSRPQRRDDRPPVGELLAVIEDLAGR